MVMKYTAIVLVVAALAAAGCKQLQATGRMPIASTSTNAFADHSALVFEPDHVDIGTVKEGEKAVGFLRVRNAGNAMANIVSVQTSCGCSVATPEQRLLMPGGFTRIKVEVDTFAKQGKARKWVQLTDDAGHRSKAWLTLHVQANPHLDASSRSIFNGKCAACHVDPAKGKVKGAEIYHAVCAMCHGHDREGVSGPSLKYHHDEDALLHMIANGDGTQHMPAFSRTRGGPLTRKQIAALAGWLSALDK